ALGIALDRGLIRSVNEPIFSFFPELSDLRSPEKDRLLVVHSRPSVNRCVGRTWRRQFLRLFAAAFRPEASRSTPLALREREPSPRPIGLFGQPRLGVRPRV